MHSDNTIGQPIPATPDDTTIYEHQDSLLFESRHAMLSLLNAPERVRRIWPVLPGMMAGRSYTVAFWRLDLARRLYANGRGWQKGELTADEKVRYEDRISTAISEMRDWITDRGLEDIIQYWPSRRRGQKSQIRTAMFKWIREAAELAGEQLSPDAPDDTRRRVVMEAVKVTLKTKRLRDSDQSTGRQRTKRPMKPQAHLAAATKHFQRYFRATFGVQNWNDTAALKANMIKEFETHCLPQILTEGGVFTPLAMMRQMAAHRRQPASQTGI
jgi:hypothetical protein